MRAIGYTRVSTTQQGQDGLGVQAQRGAITKAVSERNGELVDIMGDVASGVRTNGDLKAAMARIEAGEADALVVAKLDRMARSSLEFAKILERANKHDWSLVILDLALDTSTAMGAFAAQIMASVAELERKLISERTKAALAVARANGVVLGRQNGREVPQDVARRIVGMRESGLSYQAIADKLTAEGVPAPRAAAWNRETVRRVWLD